jgi:hypothetical protein
MTGVEAARIGIAPDRFGDQHIGRIDDLRIYSYALSEDDVAALCDGREPSVMVASTAPIEEDAAGKGGNWIAVLIIFLAVIIAVALVGRRRKVAA